MYLNIKKSILMQSKRIRSIWKKKLLKVIKLKIKSFDKLRLGTPAKSEAARNFKDFTFHFLFLGDKTVCAWFFSLFLNLNLIGCAYFHLYIYVLKTSPIWNLPKHRFVLFLTDRKIIAMSQTAKTNIQCYLNPNKIYWRVSESKKSSHEIYWRK